MTRRVCLLALFGLVPAASSTLPPSACGPDQPSKVKDCEKSDLGSCGNACCSLDVTLQESPLHTYTQLKALLESKVDGNYAYVTGGKPDPGDDLRQYNITSPAKFQFVLQGSHATPAYHGPNSDVLNFNIAEVDGKSRLRMFSSSRIHGALGDNGQNYKTLRYLLEKATQTKTMNLDGDVTVVRGCGEGQSSALRVDSNMETLAAPESSVELPPSACGPDEPSKVTDCQNSDLGTCGNACCFVSTSIPAKPDTVYMALKSLLQSKVDGNYAYVTGGSPNPGDDLRQYQITSPAKFQFILQGTHSTPAYNGANDDVLDFSVAETSAGSTLRMFSSSRIHGALGDNGQNYKSLSYLAQQLESKHGWKLEIQKEAGCGLRQEEAPSDFFT